MDLYDIFAGAESFHVRKLLEHARGLTDAQLDKPLNNPAHVFPWDTPAQSLRDLLRRLVVTKEVWTAALTGASMPNVDAEPPEHRTPEALLSRLEAVDMKFNRILADVRNRNAWSDTFVDALCEPPETFSFVGTFAHVTGVHLQSGAVVHMHPLGQPEVGNAGTRLSFHTELEWLGEYVCFVQLRADGFLHTIPVAFNVS